MEARLNLGNLEEHSGSDEATSEDLAFLSRSSRESDEVGPEDYLIKLRTVDSKNTPLLPQRVKSGSVSGSARGQALLELMPIRLKLDLNLEIKIRPNSGSAFKRLSHPLPFAYTMRGVTREWREKSDWSNDIPEGYLLIYLHKMEENPFS